MEAPGNLFTIMTLIVAPAVLTNATSVLALNTANRFGRVIDRSRQLVAEVEKGMTDAARRDVRSRQIARLGLRGQLLIRAQISFYTALGLFVTTALVSIIGAVLTTTSATAAAIAGFLGLTTGACAAAGLVYGCVLIVRESRLALLNLGEEAELIAQLRG